MEPELISDRIHQQQGRELRGIVVYKDCVYQLFKTYPPRSSPFYNNFEVYSCIQNKSWCFGEIPFPANFDRPEPFVFTQEDQITICVKSGPDLFFYTAIFNYHTTTTDLEEKCRMRRNPNSLTLYRMASNLLAQPLSKTTEILDVHNITSLFLDLETTSRSIASVPYVAAFLHRGRFMYIDDYFKLAVSIDLSDNTDIQYHSLTCVNVCELKSNRNAHPPLRSFLFGDIVLMTDGDNVFVLNTRTWRVVNMTLKLKLKDICIGDYNFTDDGEAVYIFVESAATTCCSAPCLDNDEQALLAWVAAA